MSRILRRPMFRGGRVEDKGDLKVVDKMGIAKLANGGMAQRPGYYDGDIVELYEQIDKKIPQIEKPGRQPLSTGDYLRIASAGMDILGAPSEGSGIGGALRSAAGPLSKLGGDLGSSIDAREAAAKKLYEAQMNRRGDIITGITGVQSEYDIGMAKANKKTATEISLNTIDAYYNELIEAEQAKENPDMVVIENYKSERDFSKLDVAQGGNKASKFRILNPQTIEAAQDIVFEALTTSLGREPTLEEIQAGVTKYLLGVVKGFDQGLSGLADGGRVGKANGGMMTEDVNMMTETPTGMTDVNVQETETVPAQTNEINISYDQLRDRLPPEVTDDIVLLMSQSYEALADFAEIQTQADVNQFNTKYNVQLFLPQQSGA
ncbi:hypothetical protein N9182_00055 [bacterium]|jgi:hypothetical protein|nr:hypothetical protein [bacterium]